MTATRDNPGTDMTTSAAPAEAPVSVSRRRLVRGAAVALPTILTLNSGAALATSSDLIIRLSPDAAPDGLNRMLCLDTATVEPVGKSGKLKVVPGQTTVNAIPVDPPYYDAYDATTGTVQTAVTPAEVCSQSATYPPYYAQMADGTVKEAMLNPGARISASAMASFGSAVNIVDIIGG